MSLKTIFVLIVSCYSLSIAALSLPATSNCGRPDQSELVNKTFVAIPKCIAGDFYQTTTRVGYCRCWYQDGEKCGYICDNEAIPEPGTEVKPVLDNNGQIILGKSAVLSRVRRQTTSCPPSPLPMYSRWAANSGCTAGNTYSTSTELCTCCGMVGYVCRLRNPPTVATTAAPVTTTPMATTAAPVTTTAAATTPAPATVPTTVAPAPTTVATTMSPASTTTGAPRTTAPPACPPSPFPSNAQQYIADQNCTLLAATTTQAIIVYNGNVDPQLACICTSPQKCGMLCYSLVDGSNPSG